MIPEFSNSCNDQAVELEKNFPKFAGEFDAPGKRAAIKNKLEKLKQDYQSEALTKYRELIEQFSNKIGRLS